MIVSTYRRDVSLFLQGDSWQHIESSASFYEVFDVK